MLTCTGLCACASQHSLGVSGCAVKIWRPGSTQYEFSVCRLTWSNHLPLSFIMTESEPTLHPYLPEKRLQINTLDIHSTRHHGAQLLSDFQLQRHRSHKYMSF